MSACLPLNGSYFCYSYILFKSGSWGRLSGQFIIGFWDSYNNLSPSVFRDHLDLCGVYVVILQIVIIFWLWLQPRVRACHTCTYPGRKHWKSGGDRLMSSFCTAKFLWLWKWRMGPIFYMELQLIKYWPWTLKWSGIQTSGMEEDRGGEVFVVLSQL